MALDPLWRRLAAGIPAGRWLGAPVDPRGVLGLAVGVLAAALVLTAGPVVLPLAPVAVVATAIDVRWHRLPDLLTVSATVLLGASVLLAAAVTGEAALVARAAGATTVDGLGMLVHQAARAFTLWTGVAAPVDVMRRAARAAVEARA